MKVRLNYEIRDYMGSRVKSLWKDIDMPAPPTVGLVFDESDFTFEVKRQPIYNIAENYYYVLVIENVGDQTDELIDILTKAGWK